MGETDPTSESWLLRARAAAKEAAFAVMVLSATLSIACVNPPEGGNAVDRSGPGAAAASPPPSSPTPSPTPPIAAEEPEMDTEEWFASRVDDTGKHSAILASLYPGRTIARLNPDKPFNPASLVKLATSLAALKKLGPDHRFEVAVFADGELGEDGTFEGDLYFSGGAPTFNETSAEAIREELRERGIEKITGKIFVSPDFSYKYSPRAERSASLFARELFPGRGPETAVAEKPSGKQIFAFRSHPLDEVLLYQNTFSSNFVAKRVGDEVGGPEGVRRYLVEELGVRADDVKLDSTSGLGNNAMTARGIFAVLRELDNELARHGMKPHDILPAADEGWSTLDRRLRGSALENAVAGKTGTLSAADGGVGMASLAGYVHTESGERLAFVLMDQGPSFWRHRQLQDEFLFDALTGRIEPKPVEIERPRDLLPKSGLKIEDRADLHSHS